jgi:hypothetical protein
MSKRNVTANDPTFRLATRDNKVLPSILDTLSEREAYIAVRYIARKESAAKIGMSYGISPRQVREIAARVLSKLRHPFRSTPLRVWDSNGELVDGDYVDVRRGTLGDGDLHPLVCARCPREIIPLGLPQTGGRPRKYCSGACRQAAYRVRRASAKTPEKRA